MDATFSYTAKALTPVKSLQQINMNLARYALR